MIGVLDLGLGNVNSFIAAYNQLNVNIARILTCEDLVRIDKLIIPGVGSFDEAISRMERAALFREIQTRINDNTLKILGVCVGYQLGAQGSEEGDRRGLGIYKGVFRRFPQNIQCPHLGWNSIMFNHTDPLFKDITEEDEFYFFHSYYLPPTECNDVIASCSNGIMIGAAIRAGNFWGVQFHPEKSHDIGLKLLSNFYHLC